MIKVPKPPDPFESTQDPKLLNPKQFRVGDSNVEGENILNPKPRTPNPKP